MITADEVRTGKTPDENTYTQDQIKHHCDALARLLTAKSHDYGEMQPPVILPNMSVETSILIRMSDKIQRLSNLVSASPENPSLRYNDPEVQESITDTIYDIAGYCILFLIHGE